MFPSDVEILIKVIERINKTNGEFSLGEQPHVIAQEVMYNQGVDAAVKTLRNIIEGNLKPNEFLRGLEED
jgi:hypothetical protein